MHERNRHMIGLGTIINVVLIVIGSIIGILLKHNLSDRYKSIMIQSVGLATLVVGISGALQGIFIVEDGSLSRMFVLEMILFLIIGSVIGTMLKIDENLNRFGDYMQNKFASKSNTFSKGFVTASLIFCVGAMSIMGSLEDGLTGDYSTLASKAVLDGTMSMILASTLGIGVLFSFVPVLLYQGIITILAHNLEGFIQGDVATLMTIIGNILIIGISIEILEIKKVKVANMLPAIFIPIIYYLIKGWIVALNLDFFINMI